MARLAAGRTTQLSATEIATELLRLFDESGTEPSIRALASALHVSPRAIYHYYETREQLVAATLDLVWDEAIADVLESVADPLARLDDPVEFFVLSGVATRRAFGRHRRLAMHLGIPSGPTSRLSGGMAILGAAFEQLGLSGEQAGLAMYTYATYVLGSIMLDASRSIELEADDPRAASRSTTNRDLLPDDAPAVSDATFAAIDQVVSGGRRDPDVAEELFADGLRAVLTGFVHPVH